MSVETNLPATTSETALADVAPTATDPEPRRALSQPMHVAFLPLGLAVFVILAFVLTAWTFLAATP